MRCVNSFRVRENSATDAQGIIDESVRKWHSPTSSNKYLNDAGILEQGAYHVCDSTFATPVIMRPLDHGCQRGYFNVSECTAPVIVWVSSSFVRLTTAGEPTAAQLAQLAQPVQSLQPAKPAEPAAQTAQIAQTAHSIATTATTAFTQEFLTYSELLQHVFRVNFARGLLRTGCCSVVLALME